MKPCGNVVELKKNERGSSLVEVLIAMAILAILMVGILQMFSAAYVINKHSSLKTLESYKCEQVAENIRMVRVMANINGGTLPASAANSGITLTDPFVGSLPYHGDEGTCWDYWGPGGANIVEQADALYRLYYRVNVDPLDSKKINITITAVEAATIEDGQTPYGGYGKRRVEYVTQIQ